MKRGHQVPGVTDMAVPIDLASARGREADVAELFAAQYSRLAGWVRNLVDDDGAAHDIAAEAFTRLISRWHSVDDHRGYLYVIAANLVRDRWRKLDRERRAFLRVGVARDEVDAPSDPGLRALVEALPDRLRGPVLLHYYADLPVSRIAVLLGRPEGTIKSDLHDARARLYDALGGRRDG